MEQSQLKRRLALALAVGALIAIGAFGTSQIDQLIALLEWVRTAGPVGWAAFALVYLVCTVLMVPASFQIGAAGFLLGPMWGFLAAWLGSTSTGVVSFLLARTVLRDAVSRRARSDARFHAIDGAVGEGGAYLVGLLRLSPIVPYNLVNYALGLTRVRTWDYFVGSLIGAIPSVMLWSYVGSTVSSLTELLEGASLLDLAPQLVVLVFTAIATALVARFAQRALAEALAAANQAKEDAAAPAKAVASADPR